MTDTLRERNSNVTRLVVAAIVAAFGIASLGLWGVPVIANPLEPGSGLQGNGGALAGVTSGMAQVGQTVAAQAHSLDDSLTQLQRVIGTIAAKDDDVVRILRSSTAVSQALLAQQGSLDASVTGLDRLLGTLTDFTSKEKDKIVTAVHLLATTGKQLADHADGWSRITNEVPYYSYGWYNAIHHDGNHYFMMEQISGIMFLPYPHQMNEGGGPGAAGDDHTVYPSVDFSCSPARAVVPWQVDPTVYTGPGPLLPAYSSSDGRFKIDNTPNNSSKEPGYEGGQPQTAPPPDPSGCHPQKNLPPNGGETH